MTGGAPALPRVRDPAAICNEVQPTDTGSKQQLLAAVRNRCAHLCIIVRESSR